MIVKECKPCMVQSSLSGILISMLPPSHEFMSSSWPHWAGVTFITITNNTSKHHYITLHFLVFNQNNNFILFLIKKSTYLNVFILIEKW